MGRVVLAAVLGSVLALASAVASSAFAHHSIAGVYETGRTITVEGKLTLVEIENPHSRIEIETRNGVYKVESRGVAGMTQRGFDKTAFKVGDRVVLEGAPARDGSKTLWLQKMTAPSGRNFDTSNRAR